jgi:DNA invertase Pin-like site-specific DNA recombinase
MNNVILYARTSTKKQNIKEQLQSLINTANQNNYNVIKFFKDEGKSGLDINREGFNDMLEFINNNNVNKIIITELSRISRNIEHLKEIIAILTNKNISIYITDLNIETLINNKLNTNNIIVLLDEMKYANIEVNKIKSRLKRGRKTYVENGGKVGRKVGYKIPDIELLLKYDDVVDLLNKGYSIRNIMMLTNKSNATIQKIKKILKNNGDLLDVKKITTSHILKELYKHPDTINTLKELSLYK